jgi:D-amino peptidase
MKAFICTDLEGTAGVVSFEDQAYATGKYYEQAKLLATGEVNAAVEGLLAAGVEDVVILDGHGAGGLSYEHLHPAAKLIHGRCSGPWKIWAEIMDSCDMAMMIGQHAMAGAVRGNLNHTQSSQSIDYYRLNGRLIGEIAEMALFLGAGGVPMIFLSGDDVACREAEELIPGVTTAAVKQGLSRGSAISLSAPEAQRRIREGIRQAVEKHRKTPVAPLVWKGPFVLEKRFFHTHSADAAASNPAVERVDSQTVRYRAENIRDIVYA